MKLSDRFPLHPLSLVSPPQSKVKIASRKIYVDVPPELYLFVVDIVRRINEGSKVDVQKEWTSHSKSLQSRLMLGVRNIYNVSLSANWRSGKSHILYKVNWRLLDRQLENKAKEVVRELKRNPNVGLGLLYDPLALNYVKALSVARWDNKRNLSREKTGLRDTVDWKTLKEKARVIQEVCIQLEKQFPTHSFFELSNRLNKYIYELDFKGFFLTLREILDRIFPLLLLREFISIEKVNPKLIVSYYFIYLNYLLEKGWRNRNSGQRRPSLKNGVLPVASKNFVQSVNSFNLIRSDQSFDVANMENAFQSNSFDLPIFKTEAKSFTILINWSKISVKEKDRLQRLYEICSSSVHNILSLPFISLLELKVVKHILDWYVEEFRKILIAFGLVNKELSNISVSDSKELSWSLKPLVNYLGSHKKLVFDVLKNIESSTDSIDMRLLRSFFHVYRPGISRLSDGSVNYSDFFTAVQEVAETSFNIGLGLLDRDLITIGDKVKEALPSSQIMERYQSSEIGFVASYVYLEYWSQRSSDV